MNTLKILIVEDERDLATMYKLKFEKEWFDTKIADNGLDAIAIATEFKPNIIFLDIMMPSMDGFETLRVIRELAPSLDCKIIMFTNLNKKEDIDKSMKLGADAYLLKANTTPKEAVEKIHELLAWVKTIHKEENDISEVQTGYHNCPHCWHGINIHVEITS